MATTSEDGKGQVERVIKGGQFYRIKTQKETFHRREGLQDMKRETS
jgi:hypothetical protein